MMIFVGREFTIFVMVLLSCFAKHGLAFENPVNTNQVIVEMIQAMATKNYQGTIAMYRDGRLDVHKLVHSITEGSEQEHLKSLNSPIREVIRNSEKVICLFPESQEVVVDHRPSRRSFFMDFPENITEVKETYRFVYQGKGKIASYPTITILVQPKDNYRYLRRIWISQKNKLPLKFELLDRSGDALEQAVFTELELADNIAPYQFDASLQMNYQAKHIHLTENISFDKSSFLLTHIPPGFNQIYFTHRKMKQHETPVEHLLLSDGFSAVSVYLEQRQGRYETGFKSAGAINSYSRKLKQFQVIVMGEVPAFTAQYIANGIKLRQMVE